MLQLTLALEVGILLNTFPFCDQFFKFLVSTNMCPNQRHLFYRMAGIPRYGELTKQQISGAILHLSISSLLYPPSHPLG